MSKTAPPKQCVFIQSKCIQEILQIIKAAVGMRRNIRVGFADHTVSQQEHLHTQLLRDHILDYIVATVSNEAPTAAMPDQGNISILPASRLAHSNILID